MKKRYIILAAALICSTASFAQKTKFNNELNQGLSNPSQQSQGTIEQELRDKLIPILRSASLNDAYYYDQNQEKSVDFTYNGKNYWFTVDSGSQGTIELILTTNGKNMYNDDKTLKYNVEDVLRAINEINTKYFSIKMYYDRQRGGIMIYQQTFVKSTSSISPEVVLRSLDEMDKAFSEFSVIYSAFSNNEKITSKREVSSNYYQVNIERELRDKLVPILRQAGLNAKYYDQDLEKSVDFPYKGKNYWFLAEKDGNGVVELLLTTNGREMYSGDNKKMYNEDALLQAINEVNSKYFSVKMYYDRSKEAFRICQQTFVKSTSSITPEAVIRSLDEMGNAWQYYKRAYKEIAGD